MIRKTLTACATAIALLVATHSSASAHASIQLYGSTASVNGYGVLFIRIGHGCTGGLATDTVVVSIPSGFTSVRPQQISGWTASRTMSGSTVTEVKWTGGSLPDSQFADFGISVKFPATAGSYGFKTVQYCGTANATWDGANLPMLNVKSGAEPSPASVSATQHHTNLKVSVDASSVYADHKVTLEVSSEGSVVRKFARMLDERGDLVTEIAMKGTNAKGEKYQIREGSSVVVKMDGVVIGKASLGTAASTSGH